MGALETLFPIVIRGDSERKRCSLCWSPNPLPVGRSAPTLVPWWMERWDVMPVTAKSLTLKMQTLWKANQ